MRPIDADKLLEGEHFILKCKSEFGITEMDVFRREVIDNAPTVEYPEQIIINCDTEEEKQKLLSALRNARLTIREEAENE